jgi:glycosyltransferase involved in cell wall biosynthesis
MTNTRPFFTVALPTYNRAGFLAEAIEAVLNQTFEDYELVISDNHSSDETERVVKGIRDPRLRYFRQEATTPAIQNFAFLAEQAKGEFFVLNQDDDLLHRDFLSRCHGAVVDRPDVAMYSAPLWREKLSRGYEGTLMRHPAGFNSSAIINDEPTVVDGTAMAVKLLDPVYYCLHPAVALRTDILTDVGGYHTDGSCSADLITEARVLLRGSLAYDSRVGAIMRTHATNYSNSMRKAERKVFFYQTYYQLIGVFEEHGVDWIDCLGRELDSYSTADILGALFEWTYYSVPGPLQLVGWRALRKSWPRSRPALIRKLLSKLGIKNAARLMRSWALST